MTATTASHLYDHQENQCLHLCLVMLPQRNATDFQLKLHRETQISGCLGGGRSPRQAQNPLSGERRKSSQ